MKSTKIKICGLTDNKAAIAAAEAGADLLGLVFAPSHRRITPEQAVPIIESVRQLSACPSVVGVFVNTPAIDINRIAGFCSLDVVQLSGDERPEYLREILKPVIKVIHVTPYKTAREVMLEIEHFLHTSKGNITFMLDSQVNMQYGGTGRTFNIQVAREVATGFPVFIAGGLTPENVSEVIQTVRPLGVDVSGGVETNGKKDADKIKRFIEAVRKEEKLTNYPDTVTKQNQDSNNQYANNQ